MKGAFNFPGTIVLRNGIPKIVGSAERWKRALEGHKESAHAGELDKKCQACRELQQRLKGAA
jgi:hypothetical protein